MNEREMSDVKRSKQIEHDFGDLLGDSSIAVVDKVPAKKKAGRPKSEITRLGPDPLVWQKLFLDLYSQGASDVEIKAQIFKLTGTFSEGLWTRWLKEEPIFSKTINTGRMMAQAWWENHGRGNLVDAHMGDRFNNTLWYMNMKNRYKWADRQEVKQEGAVGFVVTASSEIDDKVQDLLGKKKNDSVKNG